MRGVSWTPMRLRRLSAWTALAGFLALVANTPTAGAVTYGCSTPTSPYGSLVAGTGGLVSYWRLGQASGTTACDSKGSNAGTYQGGFTLGEPGALAGDPDTAVRLNGSTGYVSVPHGSSLDVGDCFTIEAWRKRGSVGGSANLALASQPSQA